MLAVRSFNGRSIHVSQLGKSKNAYRNVDLRIGSCFTGFLQAATGFSKWRECLGEARNCTIQKGYATEACNAVLKDGLENHNVREVLAVTLPNNLASNQLLLKLGFTHQGTQLLYGDDNNLYFRKLSK